MAWIQPRGPQEPPARCEFRVEALPQVGRPATALVATVLNASQAVSRCGLEPHVPPSRRRAQVTCDRDHTETRCLALLTRTLGASFRDSLKPFV